MKELVSWSSIREKGLYIIHTSLLESLPKTEKDSESEHPEDVQVL